MIELRSITKEFGDLRAVDGVSLSVKQGEVFGFLGPNGSGKSTTTKMLCTLLRPTAGDAWVAGAHVQEDPVSVRAAIGYVPERVPVYATMTAREYLRLFARLGAGHAARRSKRERGRMGRMPRVERERRIEELLLRVGLGGIEGRKIGGFSKGMTQRLGLARALVNDPEVLFLDEPASGLDPVARREIRELMNELAAEGKTIWLTSHDMAEVQAVCHRIAFIRQGRLVKIEEVGERAERKAVAFTLDGPVEKVADALRAEVGVTLVELLAADRLRVTYTKPQDRHGLARALHHAGGILLDVKDAQPSVEEMYLRYAHGEGTDSAELEEVRT